MADPRIKQIKIKTGVVKRLAKEKLMYEKEAQKEKLKLEKMQASGDDSYLIRKQEEVIKESIMMIPDTVRRYNIAYTELKEILRKWSLVDTAQNIQYLRETCAEVIKSEMPSYRLVDYSWPTAGEVARLLLQFREVEYQDEKVASPDELYAAEEESPFGTLPVLYVDGRAVAQGQGISRYLARELGLTGETSEEAAVCDMIMDGLGVMFAKMRGLDLSQKDVAEQVALLKLMMREDVPRHLDKYERFLENSGLASGLFASEKLTWADLGVALCLSGMLLRQPSLLDPHPRLAALVAKVAAEPAVAHFVETELAHSALVRKNSL